MGVVMRRWGVVRWAGNLVLEEGPLIGNVLSLAQQFEVLVSAEVLSQAVCVLVAEPRSVLA